MRPGTSRQIEETGTPEQKATGMPVCQRCRDSSVKHVATHDSGAPECVWFGDIVPHVL